MSKDHGLVASTRLIAGLTLLSRVLGLARECTYGYFFGTGPLLSSFRIAFMIPNLARRLFGEGALSAAFIPIFARALHDPDPEHAPRLAGAVLALLMRVLVGITLAAEVALLVAYYFRPGDTLRLTAIMFPFMAFICLAAFLGGLLNALGRFGAPAASPMILNALVMAAIILGSIAAGLSQRALIDAACGAVLLAGVGQVGLQVWALRQTGFRPVLQPEWSHPEIREIVAFMTPMIVGLSTVQINTMLDKLIALFLVPDGRGPAVLGYAHFLYQLPLGVFGIALATAIFPVLSHHAADGDRDGLRRTIERGLRLSFFISLPATVGLILVSQPLVAALFERGEFDAAGTTRVSDAVIYYVMGLCAYSIAHILVRAFYALKDARTPVRVSVVMVLVNLTLNLALVGPMREAGVALATAISATLQVAILIVLLDRRLGGLDYATLLGGALKTCAACVAMGVVVWLLAADGSPLGVASSPAVVKVCLAVPAGCLAMGLASSVLRIPELGQLLRRERGPRIC